MSAFRNEVSCETEGRIVGVPVVVNPVPVQDDLAFVLDQVRHVQVAIRVPYDRIVRHPYHRPLKNLGVEFYLTS